MARYPHILFDLDGTLIDSAPAILASYRDAFASTGQQAVIAIDEGIVGPPLLETLRMLAGATDAAVIDALAAGFKASYDSSGYRQTTAYAGVDAMLCRLRQAGCTLSIATNKRLLPTRLILEHLGWSGHFAAVYALDLFEPRLPDKATMIGRLMQDRGIARADAVYVGDRSEDGESADANQLPFIAATWGYGSLEASEMAPHWRAVASPEALADAIVSGA